MSVAKQIIAIGGGGFTRFGADLNMERYLLAQTLAAKEQRQLKVGFLPQASAEDSAYSVKFLETFLFLGAKPSVFSWFGRVESGWEDSLLEQDLIYVGGGNTKTMLAIWQAWGVDDVLQQAYNNGTVLAGVSAGAIVWFEQCVTDSKWPLVSMPALGWLPGSCCPHFDGEPERRPSYISMVEEGACVPGIALCDNVMAHYADGKLLKVVSDKSDKLAYFVNPNQELQEYKAEVI